MSCWQFIFTCRINEEIEAEIEPPKRLSSIEQYSPTTYYLCILDVHFTYDTMNLGTLEEFRDWESMYRNTRQKILLTTSDITNDVKEKFSHVVDGYLDKKYLQLFILSITVVVPKQAIETCS